MFLLTFAKLVPEMTPRMKLQVNVRLMRAGWLMALIVLIGTFVLVARANAMPAHANLIGSSIDLGNVASVPLWAVSIIVICIVGMNHLARKLGAMEAKEKAWDESLKTVQQLSQDVAVISNIVSQLQDGAQATAKQLQDTAVAVAQLRAEMGLEIQK